jgi:signal transduction histidine kinase
MPLVRSGKALGNLIHVEDVTEKRSKEARLRRAESLAALTTLAAGVAHEIKNPLGSIGIHIQLIQKAISSEGPPDKENIAKYLEVVTEEVDRLNAIVVDFLFAVRPINAEFERRSLNALVHDVLEFVQFELKQAGIEVEEKFANGIPDLDLDEKYIKQALLNVIKNAIAAMPEGGVLQVCTETDLSDVSLRITDTGIGIDEENLAKIFEPYFTTKEFGSGLGLTVVYKIIKEHGGEIAVSSKEGEGTTFTLSFPIPESERRLLEWEESAV